VFYPSFVRRIPLLGLCAVACLLSIPLEGQSTNVVLGTTGLLEGPSAGSDSIVVSVPPQTSAWTASANAPWLHLSAANQSGSGSTNVVFNFDENPNETRTGTIAIAGQTLTVTQAPSGYVAVSSATTIVSGGFTGLGVDTQGNLYMNNGAAIDEWAPLTGVVTQIVSAGPLQTEGVAVDGEGNVYIADTFNNAIAKWTPSNNALVTLVSNLNEPWGLALNSKGDVYIANTVGASILKWSVVNSNINYITSSDALGINLLPYGVAVDAAGNVYFGALYNGLLEEWLSANSNVVTLASGLNKPSTMAVDGSGNVYTAGFGPIQKWSAASNNLTTLASSGTSVTVDSGGNVYYESGGVIELPHAYVNLDAIIESPFAGVDTLPSVLPATANLMGVFAPTSDQSWLTIGQVTNGVVKFSFSENAISNRVAHINVLGETIPITQVGPNYSTGTSNLFVGPLAGSNSVVLAANPNFGIWTASANASWLHLSAGGQSGVGCTNVTFGYDANPGSTRSGSLTIAGQTVTVTQAGKNYVAARGLTPVVSSNLLDPLAVAADQSGNVYVADASNNAVKMWSVSANNVTTLVLGLDDPSAVAVDNAGNVYIADTGNNAIKERSTNGTITTLVSGLNGPSGVAVDNAGNVYIADTGNNAIKERSTNSTITTVVSGLNAPTGVAVDIAGNIYIADSGSNTVMEWSGTSSNLTVLVGALTGPLGIAVDGAGNVYIADSGSNSVLEWTVAYGVVVPLVVSGLDGPSGVAVDSGGNVYIADSGNNAIRELPFTFVDPTPFFERADAGNGVLPVVLPPTANLLPPFSPRSSSPDWLSITGTTNGIVGFSFTPDLGARRSANLVVLGQPISVSQSGFSIAIGTPSVLVGPLAGTNTVVLGVSPQIVSWTNTANASWLHLSPANQVGSGSTNIVFTYDANAGPTRVGTLTIYGQTVAVTQAPSNYVAVTPVATLISSGLSSPYGVAVDSGGNVYIADTGDNAIKEWSPSTTNLITLVSSNMQSPGGVAVDNKGNVYIADTGDSAIKEWQPGTSNLITLVSSSLSSPEGIAVDAAGNVYIADTSDGEAKMWTLVNSNLTTLIAGIALPYSIAVDAANNVYVPDTYGGLGFAIWNAANQNYSYFASGQAPYGIAVDGSGDIYIGQNSGAIQKWLVANGSLVTLVSAGLKATHGVAVDGFGNIYIADTGNNEVKVIPNAYFDPVPRLEPLATGSDSLPPVLALSSNYFSLFGATSDQPWLSITSISNGIVSFTFGDAKTNRTGYITYLGQRIPIVQGGPTYALGTSTLYVGSKSGTNSVVLAVVPFTATWTASTTANWLHLNAANQGGIGSTNVVFTFDTNSGLTRSGSISIAGQNLTIVQAGSNYVQAPVQQTTVLNLSGRGQPATFALDLADNVYWADEFGNALREWVATSSNIITLVSNGLSFPAGVAVDSSGNVYIADTGNKAIKEWIVSNSNVVTLVSSGLSTPESVAVDATGNVYISDYGANTLNEWSSSTSNVTTLVSSGLSEPEGIAVDAAGNVYIAAGGQTSIKEYIASSQTLITLTRLTTGPATVGVDGAGNVYATSQLGEHVWKWTAANGQLTTLSASGSQLAVDVNGNLFLNLIGVQELPNAFIDPTPKSESLSGGSDYLSLILPPSLNLFGLLAPTSDQPWLSISGVTNGVVAFAFPYNPGTNRIAHITLLGQSIPVTQQGLGITPPFLTGIQIASGGVFQFRFTNTPSAAFTVVSTTNLSIPLSNWTAVGIPFESPPGMYQFTSQPTTNNTQIFYGVLSP